MKEESNIKKTTHNLNEERNNSRSKLSFMVLFGVIGIIAWITMFSLGLLIDSLPYRASLLKYFDISNFFMSILTYTPTNIAVLCIIAAFSGGCASRLVIDGVSKKSGVDINNSEVEKSDSYLYMVESPFSSMLRGLVVYFSYLAGVFITNSNAFDNTTAHLYGQAAGVVSLLAFIVGYDPTVFRSFISLTGKLKQKK